MTLKAIGKDINKLLYRLTYILFPSGNPMGVNVKKNCS